MSFYLAPSTSTFSFCYSHFLMYNENLIIFVSISFKISWVLNYLINFSPNLHSLALSPVVLYSFWIVCVSSLSRSSTVSCVLYFVILWLHKNFCIGLMVWEILTSSDKLGRKDWRKLMCFYATQLIPSLSNHTRSLIWIFLPFSFPECSILYKYTKD